MFTAMRIITPDHTSRNVLLGQGGFQTISEEGSTQRKGPPVYTNRLCDWLVMTMVI